MSHSSVPLPKYIKNSKKNRKKKKLTSNLPLNIIQLNNNNNDINNNQNNDINNENNNNNINNYSSPRYHKIKNKKKLKKKDIIINNFGKDDSRSGLINLDDGSSFPYLINTWIDLFQHENEDNIKERLNHDIHETSRYFNLIIINDLFDTYEKYSILLKKILSKYHGAEILLWNYPGQAYTKWKDNQLLNNEYLAYCLNELIEYVGPNGTNQFNILQPFYLIGFGQGGTIATVYASKYNHPSLRMIVPINTFTHIDSHLAGVFHDCLNVFSCTPDSRPDLPIYFFARFLFSKKYLSNISVPMALNLYTAIDNPITIKGRTALCHGVLGNIDLRPLLSHIEQGMTVIHSIYNNFIERLHIESIVEQRHGITVSTIHEALTQQFSTCVIWIDSGHELIQEERKKMKLLFEQFIIGFHEKSNNNINNELNQNSSITSPFLMGNIMDDVVNNNNNNNNNKRKKKRNKNMNNKTHKMGQVLEDRFISNVLGKLDQIETSYRKKNDIDDNININNNDNNIYENNSIDEYNEFNNINNKINNNEFNNNQNQNQFFNEFYNDNKKKRIRGGSSPLIILDPNNPSFERYENSIYRLGSGSKIYPHPITKPKVKEYMTWRLKRNKQKLLRLENAAISIQRSFRRYLAYSLASRTIRDHAAMKIQRAYRGFKGRHTFLELAKIVWAANLVQRNWRGHHSRRFVRRLFLMMKSSCQIQRIWRGYLGRLKVKKFIILRNNCTISIQKIWRSYLARKIVYRLKHERNASITIQRIYRGILGRRRAKRESDRYFFSKNQSHGIEFGRQMLLEHKLHATKLQSEVKLLTQEKIKTETEVEYILEKIADFEEGVKILEREMHQLSQIEIEAIGVLDDESKIELREQKIRLDQEFGQMLTKIGREKEGLKHLEQILADIDRKRQDKEENLRILERKLVVLLEEQQKELENIRLRQEKKGTQMLSLKSMINQNNQNNSGSKALVPFNQSISGMSSINNGNNVNNNINNNQMISSGPSLQERKEAAQLMESTETLMKFGFMSMSMTYFSSLNMIRALRTVAAQDTVMAAFDKNKQNSNMNMGNIGGIISGGIGVPQVGISPGNRFTPMSKQGQMPGQNLNVRGWSVNDVANWLKALSLGQYSETFIEAAIDGEFLYDLTEYDLMNTLGIEHRLHRKKILNCVTRLKNAEQEKTNQIFNNNFNGNGNGNMNSNGSENIFQNQQEQEQAATKLDNYVHSITSKKDLLQNNNNNNNNINNDIISPNKNTKISSSILDMNILTGFVRHNKLNDLIEALDSLPNRKFDESIIKNQYVEDIGTIYQDAYESQPFHLNKIDNYSNTLFIIACQNGNKRIAKYLLKKGSNPNHQNKQGQTGAHYAIAYQFFKLSTWLFDKEEGAGANDNLLNKFGLTPYDGLQ